MDLSFSLGRCKETSKLLGVGWGWGGGAVLADIARVGADWLCRLPPGRMIRNGHL